MLNIALALSLSTLLQATAPAPEAPPPALAAAAAEPAPAPEEDRVPTGAPKDDYAFVAWCYGTLRGYLDLHDEVMPEVIRIENQFRRPGTKLSDDLKVYDDMQKDGQKKLKSFQAALTAAEKASVRPINTIGAQAVRQGRQSWTTGPEITKARKAQEWMSWTLPGRCERVAGTLETRAKLMGATLRVNEEESNAPSDAPASETPAAAPTPN